ncbi:AraC family transcriptional regulator [Paractinoplanes abujensis]|uniref:AraC-like DNA-binding protein n=1 Tax=Paractinoplanes abujensis TaxID=882441 RepID=A0A7W7CQ85_9ACTN|nr:AraC family transcriptional regulator [Actinoplanes abujensis]MBB4691295.1 AraC-like DNA-binding protein [Actinoplanes abujensis]GID17291.1 AraC family transcriptional regulator [Actinoplanes abujensis]
MGADRLSEVFDLVEVSGVLSGGFAASGRWFARGEVHLPLKFLAVPYGRVCLSTDGLDAPLMLEAGDVAILSDRQWLRLDGGTTDDATPGSRTEEGGTADKNATDRSTAASGAGAEPPREVVPAEHFRFAVDRERDDVVVAGQIQVTPAGRALLLDALPPVAVVRAGAPGTSSLRGCVHRIVDEMTGDRPGAAFAIRQHGQLLLLEVLRAFLRDQEHPPGWLATLRDERLRPALDLMHDHPGRAWGLPELARAAAMSRTTFAERFRAAAGVPPLTYLTRWRMLLAQRALRDTDVRIAALAAELGYASEAAFSTAFKREVGQSPMSFKRGRAAGSRTPAAASA